MKISIVISVLESHEMLRRQLLYMEKFGIKEDEEIIIVDDGSVVPLKYEGKLPVTILRLEWPERKWTASIARNRGAKIAKGEYLVCFDLDHIISRELLDMVRTFGGQKVQFIRQFGILTENGELSQKPEDLFAYGYPKSRYERKGVTLTPHSNMYAMKRDIFWELGGYNEDMVLNRIYPQGEDSNFKRKWSAKVEEGKYQVHTERPIIYTVPCGKICGDVDYNPFNLFHNSTRATKNNKFFRKQVEQYGHNRDLRFT